MGFGEAVRSVLGKYATFQGRAPRAEYWWFQLALILAYAVAAAIDFGIFVPIIGAPILMFIVMLGLLLPSLAVLIRRLHDADYAGWWFFIAFVPYIGSFILLIFMFFKSTPGENRFGPHPYGGVDAEVFE